jgi:hypothetical protein
MLQAKRTAIVGRAGGPSYREAKGGAFNGAQVPRDKLLEEGARDKEEKEEKEEEANSTHFPLTRISIDISSHAIDP